MSDMSLLQQTRTHSDVPWIPARARCGWVHLKLKAISSWDNLRSDSRQRDIHEHVKYIVRRVPRRPLTPVMSDMLIFAADNDIIRRTMDPGTCAVWYL